MTDTYVGNISGEKNVKKMLFYFIVAVLATRIVTMALVPKPTYDTKLQDNPSAGGEWNISFKNGASFENATCVEWTDYLDRSEWVLRDGTRVIQDGDKVYTIKPEGNR